MTKNREAAILQSLADELSRLAHARPTSDNDDASIVGIVRALPMLCPHHVDGLSRLAEALLAGQEEAERDPEQPEDARTVQ